MLTELQGPIKDALSIASMENWPDAVLAISQLQVIDSWFGFLLKVNDKVECSLEFCPPALTLPPYPTLGLAWMAMANNATSVDIVTSKSIHSLVNSITLVNVNKAATGKRVPVAILPRIKPPQQVAICPKSGQMLVMLSKVSIKDHPHREQIIELAKEIHAGEPHHLRQGKNA